MLFALAAIFVVASAQTSPNGYFTVERVPVGEAEAYAFPSDKICSAIYKIYLRPEFTTQGNDIGMLQPQGKNTSGFGQLYNAMDPNYWGDLDKFGVTIDKVGFDYSKYPYQNDAVKQALAASGMTVTALLDGTGTPIGFKMDVLRMYNSVCVRILNVQNRWVEVMMETPQPNRRICVEDWMPETGPTRPNLPNNPFQKACSNGHLYDCRSSPNTPLPDGSFTDIMNVRFFCESCDDEAATFYWRIVASQTPPVTSSNAGKQQQSAQDWCLMRQGTDYPGSLLNPYPSNYNNPAVFEQSTSAAYSSLASIVLLVSLVVLALFL